MSTAMTVVLIFCAIAIIATPLIILLSMRSSDSPVGAEKQRCTKLAEVAKKLNATFERKDFSVLLFFSEVPFFPQSAPEDQPRAINVMLMLTPDGVQLVTFDLCVYLLSDAKVEERFMTVAMFKPTGRILPGFQLEKKGIDPFADDFCAKNKSPAGLEITLDAQPGFTKKFRLHCNNPIITNRLFQPALCDFLTANDQWSIDCTGAWLAFCKKFQRAEVDGYEAFVKEATGVYRKIMSSGV